MGGGACRVGGGVKWQDMEWYIIHEIIIPYAKNHSTMLKEKKRLPIADLCNMRFTKPTHTTPATSITVTHFLISSSPHC